MALENLTAQNFDDAIKSNEIVVLDFWAPWCGPCKMFGPIFEKVAEDYPDILFGKINTDEEQELAGEFSISSIPTVGIMREGILLFLQPGMLDENGLRDLIAQAKTLDMDEVRKKIEKQQQEQGS